MSRDKETIISSVKDGDIYEVNIYSSLRDKNDLGSVLWADKETKGLTYDLFKMIKEEITWLTPSNDSSDDTDFKAACTAIFEDFASELRNKKKFIGEVIKEKIFALEKNEFYYRDEILPVEEIAELIKDSLLSLRRRKILYYRELLNEYMKDPDECKKIVMRDVRNFYRNRPSW